MSERERQFRQLVNGKRIEPHAEDVCMADFTIRPANEDKAVVPRNRSSVASGARQCCRHLFPRKCTLRSVLHCMYAIDEGPSFPVRKRCSACDHEKVVQHCDIGTRNSSAGRKRREAVPGCPVDLSWHDNRRRRQFNHLEWLVLVHQSPTQR